MGVFIWQIVFEKKLYERSLSQVKNFTWLDQWPICDRPNCYPELARKHVACIEISINIFVHCSFLFDHLCGKLDYYTVRMIWSFSNLDTSDPRLAVSLAAALSAIFTISVSVFHE